MSIEVAAGAINNSIFYGIPDSIQLFVPTIIAKMNFGDRLWLAFTETPVTQFLAAPQNSGSIINIIAGMKSKRRTVFTVDINEPFNMIENVLLDGVVKTDVLANFGVNFIPRTTDLAIDIAIKRLEIFV